MAAISSGFSTREKDPTWLLCSNWSRSAPGPPSDPALQSRGSGQVLQQDPDPCVDPSPAELLDIPGDYRTLQPCPASPPQSRPKRKGSRRLAYIALEKKIMKQFPCRVLKRELLSSDGLLGAGTKGLSGPAAFKLQSVPLGKRHRNEPRAA